MSDESSVSLAGHAGDYREFAPPGALADQFRCLWWHTFPAGHDRPVAVVPDGCVDLIWSDGRIMVAGPDLKADVFTPAPGRKIFGARFRPDAARMWLGIPMSEIVGQRVTLAEFRPDAASDLAGTIGNPKDTAGAMHRLAHGLMRLRPDCDESRRPMEFVFRSLSAGSDSQSLDALLTELDLSVRTLRRHCHEAFGYGPKTLQRILRFQRVMKLARRLPDTPLASLACQAGFADQAHLTREVRRLSGFSPAAMLRQMAA